MSLVFENIQTHNGAPFSVEFRRINVLMGANGSGKSQLLQALAANLVGRGFVQKPVFIEARRSIDHGINVGVSHDSLDILSDPAGSQQKYLQNRSSHLSNRMRTTLKILIALEQSLKAQHSDAVEAWSRSDRTMEMPRQPELPFEQFRRLFNTIFPDLNIRVQDGSTVIVVRNGSNYPASSLSDGEKQVYMLTADLLSHRDVNQAVFVDEPEVNLHPELAERFWDIVEAELSESRFIYATHSIAFAMRPGVELVYLLGHGPIDLQSEPFASEQLRPFLGGFSRIGEAKNILLVEGLDSSLDTLFYRWITGSNNLAVIPLGGSSEIVLAAGRRGLWEHLSSTLQITGIIDRDFKSDNSEFENCLKLPFHELESMLAHPMLVYKLQSVLANIPKPKSFDELINVIVAEAFTKIVYVSVQRTFKRLTLNLNVSSEKRLIASFKSIDEAISFVQKAAALEGEKSKAISNPDIIQAIMAEEFSRCQSAVDSKNLEDILILFEGKPFLNKMFGLSGCPSPMGMMIAVAKHLSPDDFEFTSRIRRKLTFGVAS